MLWLFTLALILLFFGWLASTRSRRLRLESGVPAGRLVYADSADWRPNPQPFYTKTYQLRGKPDYLIETEAGIIPVEVKSSKAPQVPYLGHLLQLAAYCLLVEETTGRTPPHGLLKYADALYEVDFTPELRHELLETMAAMRQARLAETVGRSHQQPGRCAACGFAYVCDDALIRWNEV
ncbi:MAG: CRISPR-associated protein Cas4 [Chloroflexota bacterium]|nr:MAG: CRISPR-associated protein Cas4 [Chloroflexota bacterium]